MVLLQHAVFETDSKIFVDDLVSSRLDISEFGTLVEQCRSLLLQQQDFSVIFSHRETNMVAHCLARSSTSFPSLTSWSSPPSFIVNHLVKDATAIINT